MNNIKTIIYDIPHTEGGVLFRREKTTKRLPGKIKINGFVGIKLRFFLKKDKKYKKIDLDNLIKFILDRIVEKKYISDDSLILKIEAEKIFLEKKRKEKTEIEIYPIRP